MRVALGNSLLNLAIVELFYQEELSRKGRERAGDLVVAELELTTIILAGCAQIALPIGVHHNLGTFGNS